MSIFRRKEKEPSALQVWLQAGGDIAAPGYTTLDKCPEVLAAINRIAGIVGSMTIHLITNTSKGDERILNALSRKVDIEPNAYQTRSVWVQGIVRDMLIYGNAVNVPVTKDGLLDSINPISARVCRFVSDDQGGYYVDINGKRYSPHNLLHFVYNPDPSAPWRGQGLQVALRPIVDNLAQAAATNKAFLSSKFNPSIIVSVDSTAREFDDENARNKLADKYISAGVVGKPWIIPAEQLKVEQVKPLTLKDLAISDSIKLDKRTVAALLGVPPFVVGDGEFNEAAWNNFVQSVIGPLFAVPMQQELTRKIVVSPKWYFRFNVASLYSYDLQTMGSILGSLWDRGIVNGDEVRERLPIGLNPAGLTTYNALENYIPVKDLGNQNKIKGDDG